MLIRANALTLSPVSVSQFCKMFHIHWIYAARNSKRYMVSLLHFRAATILIDTSNLSVDVGKSTPRDEDVVKQLSGKRTKDELNLLFRSVTDAKFSVSGLTTEEIILKVMKQTLQFCFIRMHDPCPNKSFFFISFRIQSGLKIH